MTRYERRSTDRGDVRNWALDCEVCGYRFGARQVVAETAVHWNEHVDARSSPPESRDEPRLRLTWIGVGPPPKERPHWLQ